MLDPMIHLPAFLSSKEWPSNLYVLKNNTSDRKSHIYVPHQVGTKYSLQSYGYLRDGF